MKGLFNPKKSYPIELKFCQYSEDANFSNWRKFQIYTSINICPSLSGHLSVRILVFPNNCLRTWSNFLWQLNPKAVQMNNSSTHNWKRNEIFFGQNETQCHTKSHNLFLGCWHVRVRTAVFTRSPILWLVSP